MLRHDPTKDAVELVFNVLLENQQACKNVPSAIGNAVNTEIIAVLPSDLRQKIIGKINANDANGLRVDEFSGNKISFLTKSRLASKLNKVDASNLQSNHSEFDNTDPKKPRSPK